jgi:arylsulfatase A-like enzyme
MYAQESLSLLPGWLETCLSQDLAFHRGYFSHEALTEAKLRRAMAFYYATISQIDHHVGRMVDLLKRKGLYDDTMIVYTSDHGDYMGFHHLLLKGNYMYDPLVKVPLIIKFPQQARASERSEALVNSIDLAPTVLGCAGCEIPAAMQGANLTVDVSGREMVFAEGGRGHAYMVRSDKHKLLLCQDGALSQFFDLEHDPYETRNLIHDQAYRADIADLRSALGRWALFGAPSLVYRDERAPIIGGDTVPVREDGHEERACDYFRSRMGEPYTWSA